MFNRQEIKSFKLVIGPGNKKLRSGDYWAVLGLCVIASFVLLMVVGLSI